MAELSQNTVTSTPLLSLRRVLILAGPLVVAVVAFYFYLTGGRFVATDDSTVQLSRTDISSTVPGQVIKVMVHDNQRVHKGDPLFALDERSFRIAVQEAQAQLGAAKLQIEALKAVYLQRQAERRAAQDMLVFRQTELQRQRKLAGAGIASQAQLDQAEHAEQAAKLQLDQTFQTIQNTLANLDGNADIIPEQHPAVQQAQALLDRALLNLSYTMIKAPSDGIVTKVEQVQVGDYVTTAAPLFSLLSTSDIWVEANFKETDLTFMQTGQSADIEIDSYPGRHFSGHVASISPGTGSSFSMLPPENASGNWVKVVQRLPVRITLDTVSDDTPLRSGLSATVTVDTNHQRHLFGVATK
jgi:membrane fusion protein (multidrug efflux system)